MGAAEQVRERLKSLSGAQKALSDLVLEDDVIRFGAAYQLWYTAALKLVQALAPDRLIEFRRYYEIDPKRKIMDVNTYVIQDYVQGIIPAKDHFGNVRFDHQNVAAIRLISQFQLVASLESRIEGILADVAGHLYAEIQDAELVAATKLKRISVRAAGAIAGVVLERHLQRVAVNRQLSIGKTAPTIADLNDLLKKSEVYDVPAWRSVQYLADIRNLCSHQKEREPTIEDVDALIAGVDKIIKTVF